MLRRTRLTAPRGLCAARPCQGLNDRSSQNLHRQGARTSWGLLTTIVATCSMGATDSFHSTVVPSMGVRASSTYRWTYTSNSASRFERNAAISSFGEETIPLQKERTWPGSRVPHASFGLALYLTAIRFPRPTLSRDGVIDQYCRKSRFARHVELAPRRDEPVCPARELEDRRPVPDERERGPAEELHEHVPVDLQIVHEERRMADQDEVCVCASSSMSFGPSTPISLMAMPRASGNQARCR